MAISERELIQGLMEEIKRRIPRYSGYDLTIAYMPIAVICITKQLGHETMSIQFRLDRYNPVLVCGIRYGVRIQISKRQLSNPGLLDWVMWQISHPFAEMS